MSKLRSFINWSATHALCNHNLEVLLATCEDEEILAGLKVGFPQLFSDKPQSFPIPWSVVKEKAYAEYQKDYASDGLNHTVAYTEHNLAIRWGGYVRELLPIVDLCNVPVKIVRQLPGQKLGWDSMRVMWRNEEWVVCMISVYDDLDAVVYTDGLLSGKYFDEETDMSAVGKTIASIRFANDDDTMFRICPVRCIDFDS